MKKRKWVIPVVLIVFIFMGVSCSSCRSRQRDHEKIQWETLSLGSILPKPESKLGKLHQDDETELWVDLAGVTEQQYKAYVVSCQENGFTIDDETTSFSYEAYQQDRYKVRLSYYGSMEEMSIQLDAPMEMKEIVWPSSKIAALLPVPKSNMGYISWERSDGFSLFVGDTAREAYEAYVSACMERGFDVDYEKGESYYRANDQEGNRLSLNYEGFYTMRIQIEAPDERAPVSSPDEENPSGNPQGSADGVDPEFKQTMDRYEAFFDEYVDFMQRYANTDDPASMMSDYLSFLGCFSEAMEQLGEIDEDSLTAAEQAYYLEVLSRIDAKLLAAAQ